MKIAKSEAIEKLHRLGQSEEVIVFSISGRGWPTISANGEGLIEKVSDDKLQIEGNGRLFVTFADNYDYELSGHYPHRLGSGIFGSSKRARCMTIRNEYVEAHLVFRTGAARARARARRRSKAAVPIR